MDESASKDTDTTEDSSPLISKETNYEDDMVRRRRRREEEEEDGKKKSPENEEGPFSNLLEFVMKRGYILIAIPLVVSCCIYFITRSTSTLRASPTLVKVFVSFRHGSRAPITYYATDIYRNQTETIWPEGFEKLTKKGKRESYELGKNLRERYKEFVGPFFKQDEVNVFSTLKDRTLMSGQLVMASFFPPVEHQQWNEDLNWQPVPIYPEYMFNETNGASCSRFTKEAKESLRSEFHRLDPELKQVIGLIVKNAAEPNGKPWEIFVKVWDAVYFQDRANLKLPSWIRDVYPEKMTETALTLLKAFLVGSDIQRRILLWNYAYALNDFLLSEDKRKMEFHSWHDLNIISILRTLGAKIDRFPEPSSCVVIEMHNRRGETFFEAYYYDSFKTKEPRQLEMQCGMSCSTDDLKMILEQYKVDNYTKLCNSGDSNSLGILTKHRVYI